MHSAPLTKGPDSPPQCTKPPAPPELDAKSLVAKPAEPEALSVLDELELDVAAKTGVVPSTDIASPVARIADMIARTTVAFFICAIVSG
jgi:hypothetical protein